jgi:hypothetical protein
MYFGILGTVLSSLGVSQMPPSYTLKMEPVRYAHTSNYEYIWSQNIPPKPLCKFTRLNFIYLLMYLFLDDLLSSIVGWSTVLQAGTLRVRFLIRSLDFSIDLILPFALLARGRLSL